MDGVSIISGVLKNSSYTEKTPFVNDFTFNLAKSFTKNAMMYGFACLQDKTSFFQCTG